MTERISAVVLVDGNSLLYRAHFAFIRSPLRNARGENTSAAFGFVNSLRRVLDRFEPEYAAVVFDAPGRSFRHEQFAAYKAQRPETPPDLIRQSPIARDLVRAHGLRLLEVPGVEADDVLGTLALRFAEAGRPVLIVTSDKDLLQLVSGNVRVYDPFKDTVLDREAVLARLGVPPERVADLLALSGDSSDNVPGVPGIGPKRAQELLLKYRSFDEILVQEPRVAPHQDLARLSRSLTGIRIIPDLPTELAELRPVPVNVPELQRLFTDLEFTSLLQGLSPAPEQPVQVLDRDRIDDFDQVTTSGLAATPEFCCFAQTPGQVIRLPRSSAAAVELLSRPGLLKVGHDLKAALRHARSLGQVVSPLADTMIAAWLLDPNRRGLSLPELLLAHCNRHATADDCPDAASGSLELWHALRPKLEGHGMLAVFQEIEMPLLPVLARMELRGIRVDKPRLTGISQELAREIAGLESRIYDQVGMAFNLRSPRQLSEVLYSRLGLRPGRRTQTGFSTDARALQQMAESNPVVADILRVRELTKLETTYIEPLARLADPETGRVHTTFNQTGTGTGRLSTSNPNLQNIPIRTETGRRIREAFIAREGFVLVSADYAQIELRVLAELSADQVLRSAFAAGTDIHSQTACAVLGCAEQDVTPEARRIAKMVNYGLIYGMSEHGLAARLGLERDAARAFIESYLSRYRGVALWSDEVVRRAESDGGTRTAFGRFRPLPDLRSPNRQVAEAARRAAINSPIQGTAADITKRAMIALDRGLTDAGFQGGMVLQIHDELLLEVEAERADEAADVARRAMTAAWPIQPPLVVDIGVGPSWADAH